MMVSVVTGALTLAALALLALVAAGIVYQALGSAADARRFPPPGRLVDVGGHRLHATCLGQGAPAVVLESAIGGSSLSWAGVQPDIARFTSACAYDRAGLGWSDAAAPPRTSAHIIEELHAVIGGLDCAAPYVMVGHSFGALVCLAYSRRYPQEVGGLVLLDPPTEWAEIDRRQARLLWGGVQMARLGALLASLGVVRLCLALLTGGAPAVPRHFVKVFGPVTARTLERLVGEVRKLPPHVHPVVKALWCRPKCFRALAGHLRALRDVAAAASLAPTDVPLVVVSSGHQAQAVVASHQALARVSPRGRHVIAPDSHHWVQFDQPGLVVTVVREVVEDVRGERGPNGARAPAGPHGAP